jgi:heterodisulfide reductase subunit A
MTNKEQNTPVLVIGGGIAGIETSLLLANSGRKVYLVEKTSYIGGNVIKFEEVFPNMDCATCMIAPKQQELLADENIELLRLSQVESVSGSAGDFSVKVRKNASYVDLDNCIGCNACFDPCPVEVDNEFEEGLAKRKAIYIPCAGALPNVPVIDTENCVRFKGKECQACQEAGMFEAIDYNQKDVRRCPDYSVRIQENR